MWGAIIVVYLEIKFFQIYSLSSNNVECDDPKPLSDHTNRYLDFITLYVSS